MKATQLFLRKASVFNQIIFEQFCNYKHLKFAPVRFLHMILTYLPNQLSADMLAGILNQAFIKSEVVKKDDSCEFVNFSMNNIVCSMSVLGNTIQMNHVIHSDLGADLQAVKKIVDHINDSIIHSKYVGMTHQGSHLIAFHHSNWIPEDETISEGYIVKLARSFISFQEKHLAQWSSTVKRALHA